MTKSRNLRRRKVERHGKRYTPEYGAWKDMLRRCCNPKFKQYMDYGGRGVEVCPEWRDSFSSFYDDMGPKPSLDFSLERVDNEKGYFKDNCKWAIRSVQMVNQRRRKNSSHLLPVGVRRIGDRFHSRISINKKEYHLGSFATPQQAGRAFDDVFKEWYGFNSPKNNNHGNKNE